MNLERLFVEFATVFAVALAAAATVTILWSFIDHGDGVIDWQTSFRLAIIFGTILAWVKSREIKEG